MRSGEQRGQDGGESALRRHLSHRGPQSGVLGEAWRQVEKSWEAGFQAESRMPGSGPHCGLGQPRGLGQSGPPLRKVICFLRTERGVRRDLQSPRRKQG